MVSPKRAQAHDRFLTVLQAGDGEPLPVADEENDAVVIVRIADRVVALAKGTEMICEGFEVTVPTDGKTSQVLLAGLQPGAWRIATAGAPERDALIEPGKNTFSFESRGGRYRIAPR